MDFIITACIDGEMHCGYSDVFHLKRMLISGDCMYSDELFAHIRDTVGKKSQIHLSLKQSPGDKTDNGPHVLHCAGTTSLFLLKCHGNYIDAQFKMITTIMRVMQEEWVSLIIKEQHELRLQGPRLIT